MLDEPSTHSRRTVVAAVVALLVSVPGCSILESDPPGLDIVFINNTDSRFMITVHLRANGDGHSEGELETFSAPIEIGPQEEVRREDIAESQQYLIEYDVDKIVDGDPLQTDHDHAHFYPTEGGDNPSIAFDIVGSGTLSKRIS
jgi:hypothetical protein